MGIIWRTIFPALKIIGQIFFILQSVILLLPVSLYRIFKRIITLNKTESLHFNPFKSTHEDVFKHRSDVLKVEGYRIQEFEFQTDDEAYVSFWRIVLDDQSQFKNKNKRQKENSPVVIQHGLLDCSMSWFLHENIQNCLPYKLANAGYDVWVGNNRGTKYSNRNSHKFQYWQYNLDHLIHYDIPCIIKNITKIAKAQKLIYIGHSQGTTQFFASMDLHPQLHCKIENFIGFGPVISLMGLHDHSLIKIMDKIRLCEFLKLIGFKSLLIIPNWMSKLIGILIYNCWFYFNGFYLIVTGLCGKNQKQAKINLKRFGVIISHEPGGSSITNVLHWIQMYRKNGILARYDYGKKKNMEIYGSEDPPIYNFNQLKNMPFNCHLFRGTSDRVITEESFNYLKNKLNQQKYYVYELQDFAHLDYIWSEEATNIIYDRVLQILSQETHQDSLQNQNTKNGSSMMETIDE